MGLFGRDKFILAFVAVKILLALAGNAKAQGLDDVAKKVRGMGILKEVTIAANKSKESTIKRADLENSVYDSLKTEAISYANHNKYDDALKCGNLIIKQFHGKKEFDQLKIRGSVRHIILALNKKANEDVKKGNVGGAKNAYKAASSLSDSVGLHVWTKRFEQKANTLSKTVALK